MEARWRLPNLLFAGMVRAAGYPRLGRILELIDAQLRRRHGVTAYSQSPACAFRIDIGRSSDELTLPDGTYLRKGDRIVVLHFWIERIPAIPRRGPTLGWAKRLSQSLEFSLRELACHVQQADLADIIAVRADVPLGSRARATFIAKLVARFGLHVVRTEEIASLRQRLHRTGENLFISLQVFARHSSAPRDSLRRERFVAYMSRRELEQRFGSLEAPATLPVPLQP